jgi:glucose/arabinose dehydrogenase
VALAPIGAGLSGPAGSSATVYATGLPAMSAFAFDSLGRLWITTSGATDHAHDGVSLVRKRGAAPVKVVRGAEGAARADLGRQPALRRVARTRRRVQRPPWEAFRAAAADPRRAERPQLEQLCGSACAGVPTPLGVLDKHAAAGAVAVRREAALVTEWQLGRVQRVGLAGLVTPYLSGLKNPLPIAVSPDGAVLVGDWGTGTIYRIS